MLHTYLSSSVADFVLVCQPGFPVAKPAQPTPTHKEIPVKAEDA